MSQNGNMRNSTLKHIYSQSNTVFVDWVSKSGIIEEVTEETGAEPSQVETELTFASEDGLVEADPKTVRLQVRGGSVLMESGVDTSLDSEIQAAILERLLEEKRADTTHPRVQRADLLDVLDAEEHAVDDNVRYLSKSGKVDLMHGNGEKWHSAEITGYGRRSLR